MDSFQEYVNEYQKQMQKGIINKAYKGLMDYMMGLRTHFQNKFPTHFVSGSLYFGYMDMTYFSVIPESLKKMKLKAAIVFVHDSCRFEIWLAGYNKQVQSEYWKLFKENDWNKYPVVPTIQGADSIIESVLVADPDFNDLDALTKQIENATLIFIRDVESFLAVH
jgi:hypothetical protein